MLYLGREVEDSLHKLQVVVAGLQMDPLRKRDQGGPNIGKVSFIAKARISDRVQINWIYGNIRISVCKKNPGHDPGPPNGPTEKTIPRRT